MLMFIRLYLLFFNYFIFFLTFIYQLVPIWWVKLKNLKILKVSQNLQKTYCKGWNYQNAPWSVHQGHLLLYKYPYLLSFIVRFFFSLNYLHSFLASYFRPLTWASEGLFEKQPPNKWLFVLQVNNRTQFEYLNSSATKSFL